jgi:2Fe-2S ferredoxin
MPKITYIEADGKRTTAEVPIGQSVMQGALDHGVSGILAECGGSCSCGTCRIYIDDAWAAKTGTTSDIEEATLEGHDDPNPNKRLSCQLMVSEDLDGLIVRLPRSQI